MIPADATGQLGELEVLQSMFPGEGELEIPDESMTTLSSIRNIAEGQEESPCVSWSFVLNFESEGIPCRLSVHIPPSYPSTSRPDFQCSCSGVDSRSLDTLTTKLKGFVRSSKELPMGEPCVMQLKGFVRSSEELPMGEPCVMQVFGFMQEHLPAITSIAAATIPASAGTTTTDSTPLSQADCGTERGGTLTSEITIQRTWISFMGFYQDSIIEAFCAEARSLGLTGFLAAGKPAVAAVEGSGKDIATFLKAVRTQLFARVPQGSRKMSVELDEQVQHRTFPAFERLTLHSTGSHHRSDMLDLGELAKFLDSCGCSHAFKLIFGSGA
eukprot:gene7272-384_t